MRNDPFKWHLIKSLYFSCISSRYFIPVGSVRIDFEEPPNENLQVDQSNLPQGVYNIDPNIGLIRLDKNVVSSYK